MNKIDLKKIGNTPLIRLNNIEKHFNITCHLYGKLESENLTGSIKDRPALNMILDLNKKYQLKPPVTLIEATSGNTGISLAAIGAIYGYKVIIIMPSSMSKQRQEMMKKYHADLRLVDGGMKQCHDLANQLHDTIKNSYIVGQFENPSNYEAHIKTTGPEIEKQCPNCKYIFAGFGTGGTVSGLAMYFDHKVKIIAIEPKQSPLITKGFAAPHLIQGIGANFVPENFKKDLMDDIISVDDKTSLQYAKLLNEMENINVGYSSGAALLGAITYIKENNITDKDVVVILPDKGDRYSWN